MQSQATDDYSEIDQEEQQRQQEEMLQLLGGRLLALAEEQVRNKQQLEQRWLEDLRQVHGVLTADEQAKLAKAGKSQVVVNITRNKANAAEARLSDLAAPTDSRHWGINPTPVPELDEAMNVDQVAFTPQGQPVNVKDFAKAKLAEARQRADKMEQTIDDQCTEAKLNGKIRAIIHDGVRLGTGIIKGPVIVGRSRRSWDAVDPEQGVYALTYAQDFRPGLEVVSPWNFFPDMRACTIDEAEFTFERKFLTKKMLRELAKRPGYLVNQIKELLRQEPSELAISSTHTDEIRQISGVDTAPDDNRYEMWEYHGEISKEDLIAAGCEVDEDDSLSCYNGIIEFCGTRVIRAMVSPMETGDCIYSVFNWERDSSNIFGYGIPYLMRHSQKVINSAWRMLMDNAGLCTGGQVVIDQDKLTPADGRWELAPRKIWLYSDRNNGSVRDAFALHEIASHQQELQAIFVMARQLADEETNLPLIAQGEQAAHITDTAKGMSILMASADVVLRKTVKLLDDGVYKPLITRFYDFNMQFSDDETIKGDFEVDARGSDALLEDAAREQGLLETAQLVNDPTYGKFMKPREMLAQILKGKKLSPDEMLKSDAELQEEAQRMAQQGPPIDPIKKAELDLKAQALQLKQAELQMRQQYEQADLQLKRELGLAKLALEERMSMEKLYRTLGLEKEKVATTRQIAGVNAMATQDEMALKRQMGSGI